MFDEEVRSLVNDVALAEYIDTFTTTCNQEVSICMSLQDPLVSIAVLSVIFCEVFSETQWTVIKYLWALNIASDQAADWVALLQF